MTDKGGRSPAESSIKTWLRPEVFSVLYSDTFFPSLPYHRLLQAALYPAQYEILHLRCPQWLSSPESRNVGRIATSQWDRSYQPGSSSTLSCELYFANRFTSLDSASSHSYISKPITRLLHQIHHLSIIFSFLHVHIRHGAVEFNTSVTSFCPTARLHPRVWQLCHLHPRRRRQDRSLLPGNMRQPA